MEGIMIRKEGFHTGFWLDFISGIIIIIIY